MMRTAILTGFLFVTGAVAYAATPCAPTPTAAVQAFEEGAITETATGYRVVKLRTDAALNITWVDLKRCDHPEWPALSIVTNASVPHASETRIATRNPITIRPGETVHVWRNEANAHLEMAAISDEGGAVGDRIRLHLATASGEPVRYCFGLVRGPGNVEME